MQMTSSAMPCTSRITFFENYKWKELQLRDFTCTSNTPRLSSGRSSSKTWLSTPTMNASEVPTKNSGAQNCIPGTPILPSDTGQSLHANDTDETEPAAKSSNHASKRKEKS